MTSLKYHDPVSGLWKYVDGFFQPHPQCRISSTVNQAVQASGAMTPVVFDTVDYDTGGMADVANNRILIPLTGYWRFTVRVSFQSNPTGYRATLLYKAGSVVLADEYVMASATSGVVYMFSTEPLWCVQGDVITVSTAQTSGASIGMVMTNGRGQQLTAEYAGLVGAGAVNYGNATWSCRETAITNSNLAVVVPLTGASVSVQSLGTSDVFLVIGSFDFENLSSTSAACIGFLYVDGIQQSAQAVFTTAILNLRACVCQSWFVTGLAAGNHTFDQRMSLSGSGSFRALTHSGLSIQRVAIPGITVGADTPVGAPLGVPSGSSGYASITANAGGTTATTLQAVPGLSISPTLDATRRYRITVGSMLSSSIANDRAAYGVLDGATPIHTAQTGQLEIAGSGFWQEASVFVSGVAGVKNYNMGIARGPAATGTITALAAAGVPAYIVIEDVGPA